MGSDGDPFLAPFGGLLGFTLINSREEGGTMDKRKTKVRFLGFISMLVIAVWLIGAVTLVVATDPIDFANIEPWHR